MPVTVVRGNVPTLLGRDWLSTLKMNWPDLFPEASAVHLLAASNVSELLSEFPEVFTDNLGCMKDYKVHILLPESASPLFFKARPVP